MAAAGGDFESAGAAHTVTVPRRVLADYVLSDGCAIHAPCRGGLQRYRSGRGCVVDTPLYKVIKSFDGQKSC